MSMSQKVGKDPYVSVIIPVWNDSKGLALCLPALERQTYPKDQFEVILVDNASTEDLSRFSKFAVVDKFLTESCPGSYAARNLGIQNARGEILCFLDSDCVPERSWLEAGVKALESDSASGLVGGKVEVLFGESGHPTAVELFEKLTAFDMEKYVEEYHFTGAGNLFTWRKVIDKVGMFWDQLKSGGDLEWGQRVWKFGYKQLYEPKALVYHPARNSICALRNRFLRIAGGQFTLEKKKNNYSTNLFYDLKHCFFPSFHYVRLYWSDPRLQNWTQKMRLSWVLFLVRYWRSWERIRLRLGAAPRR